MSLDALCTPSAAVIFDCCFSDRADKMSAMAYRIKRILLSWKNIAVASILLELGIRGIRLDALVIGREKPFKLTGVIRAGKDRDIEM